MQTTKQIKWMASLTALFLSPALMAAPSLDHPFYIAADVGVFQANFNQQYLDLVDVIPANVANSLQQNGYTGGIAIGYNKLVQQKYLVGAQLSGNFDTSHAYQAEGASSLTFNDTIEVNGHADLTFVPGLFLSDSVAAYAKLGVSVAALQDTLTSPAGFTATMTRYKSNQNVIGFAAGLGLEDFLTDRVSVFAEMDYHDYGVINFSNFENYAATYSHSAHVYSYAVEAGFAVNLG